MRKLTYDQVKQDIEKTGYKLLSTEYVNNVTKLKMMCTEGHIFEMTYGNFYTGYRCAICNGQKHTYSYVKDFIEDKDYKLLSTEYVNNVTKLKIQCPEGHIFEMRYNDFQSGCRCPVCNGNKKLTYDQVKQIIENVTGYKLISTEYKNAHSKIKMMCTEGHTFEMRYNSFRAGSRCPECNKENVTSKGEKEIVQYVSSIYNGNIIENDRSTIVNHLTGKNLELDIYLPDINKAIEYNGLYWHSGRYQKIKDKIKRDQCKSLGIDLLVIDEKLWTTDKSSCLNQVREHII